MAIRGKPLPEHRAWAHQQLGTRPDADAAQVRRALLERVAQENFVPEASLAGAYALIQAGRAKLPAEIVPCGEAMFAAETALREKIDRFAESLYKQTPEQRQKRWQELAERARQYPRLLGRLLRLEGVLQLERLPPELKGTDAGQLAGVVLRTMVLAPIEAAQLRRQFVAGYQGREKVLRAAAAQLTNKHPQLAALQPEFVGELAARPGRLPTPAPRKLPPATRHWNVEFHIPVWLRVAIIILSLGFSGAKIATRVMRPLQGGVDLSWQRDRTKIRDAMIAATTDGTDDFNLDRVRLLAYQQMGDTIVVTFDLNIHPTTIRLRLEPAPDGETDAQGHRILGRFTNRHGDRFMVVDRKNAHSWIEREGLGPPAEIRDSQAPQPPIAR